ncbi:MAG: hypothetical protein RIE32_13965 [Phycisphaerales bacterium]
MSTINRTKQGILDFFNQRIAPWSNNAEQLLLSTNDITTLTALLSDANTKFNEAQEGWNEYKAMVDAQDEALNALYDFGSLLVQQIRVNAKKDGTDELYQLAQIDPPRKATPRTEAPIPTNLALRSTTNGNLVLTYEANKGQGSVFVIQRRYKTLDGVVSSFQYMDTTGEKEWTDTDVPGGLEWIAYQVATKLTTNVVSDWSDEKTFNFGTIGNQNPQASGQASTTSEGGGGDGGEGLTIEDAQQLKDAQTAKGSEKAG